MFPTLLSNLQTLISSRFLVSSFFPTIGFWFANATMIFLLNAPFQEFIRSNIGQTAGLTAVVTAAVLIGVAFSAYGEAALLPTIQSLMEGNWPAWMVAIFAPSQMNGYERLKREERRNLRLHGSLGTARGPQTLAQVWHGWLTTARQAGGQMPANNYTGDDPTAKEVARLARIRARARAIDGNAINAAVTALTLDLRANNANLAGPDGNFALEDTRRVLWELIDYAYEYATSQYRSLITKRQFSAGAPPLAPTRMGNVAKTVQSYAVSRYDFNFEVLWSRLQLSAQRDKDFGPLLQATKTQLDFLVSCSALTYLWAATWAVWLYATSGPALVFLLVALLGALAGYIWYRVAVAQYRTLADLLRSSVDLFRFDLLAALHYPQPEGVLDERNLWETIDALHVLYERRDLRYTPPKR